MNPAARLLRPAILLAVVPLVACAPATRVVLLPHSSGKPTAVQVSTPQGNTVLDSPYAQADVGSRGQVTTGATDAKTVQKRYGAVLEKLPEPLHFRLYFNIGTSELTSESQAELQSILEQATSRPGSEIFVTGYTDSAGSSAANDALSLRRAEAIRQMLIGMGFNADRVIAVGRGNREPLVPTQEHMPEPKNRRAEIEVR